MTEMIEMRVEAAREPLFQAFLATMKEEKVPFCILDGYKENHLSSDIDFMVSPEDFRRLPEILKKLEAKTDGRILQALQHESESCYYVLAKNSPKEESWAFLHLDACANYRIRGKRWLSAKEVLRSVQERDGVPVPAVEDAFRYYLIKKIQKERLERSHWSYLRSLYEKAPTVCLGRVRDVFSVQKMAFLADCLSEDDYEGFRAQMGEWKRGMRKAHLHVPELLRAIKRVFRPTGLFVVFLGPDGSGKSSVIQGVEAALAPAFRRTHTAHLKPGLCCRRRASVPDATRPHAQKSYGPFASLAKLFFFWLDYALGFWRLIFPKLVRSTLVLYDRYYPDILVDPRRYRYGGPSLLARALGVLLPKPDLWILLDAPTEVLQERKQEVPPDETARQRVRYRRLIRSLGGHVVSTAQPLDSVVSEVNQLIADHLEKRMRS